MKDKVITRISLKSLNIVLFFIGFIALIILGCSKEGKQPEDPRLPVINTNPISNIKSNSVLSGGNVTSNGTTNITARGVCWNTSTNPTVSNSKTVDGTGLGTFTSSVTNLKPNTNYYLRAYGTNSSGTGYGEIASFTTSAALPGSVSINLSWDIKRQCGANTWWPCWDVIVGLGYSQSEVDKEAYFNFKSLSDPGTYNATQLAPGTYYYRAKKTVRTNCYLSGDQFCGLPSPIIKSGSFTITSSQTKTINVSL